MALMISDTLNVSLSSPVGASRLKLALPKKALSFPYNLKSTNKYIITGKILSIRSVATGEIIKGIEELKGKEIKFIFEIGASSTYDWIYFSEESWVDLRDYGILAEQHLISVELDKIEDGTQHIEIYPKRNVIV